MADVEQKIDYAARARDSSMAPFVLGRTYRTIAGDPVTIINLSILKGYECIQGDDISPITGVGRWRYNRVGNDLGRCTGSAHDFSSPNNLIPEPD
jgi:hypothetical protein